MSNCKAFSCQPKQKRTLLAARAYKLSRKCHDSLQTLLVFSLEDESRGDEGSSSWGRDGNQKFSNPGRRAGLAGIPPPTCALPAPRGHPQPGDRRGGARGSPTYLSARSLSPRSASAIPSKPTATSRPMARKPGALPCSGLAGSSVSGAIFPAPQCRPRSAQSSA